MGGRRGIQPVKKPVPFIPGFLFQNKRRKTKRDG